MMLRFSVGDGDGRVATSRCLARDVEGKRLARRPREAKLRQTAVIEETDYRTPRCRSLLITNQISVVRWHDVIGDLTHRRCVGPRWNVVLAARSSWLYGLIQWVRPVSP